MIYTYLMPVHVDSLNIEEIFKNTTDSEKLQPQDYSFLNPNNIYQTTQTAKVILDYTNYCGSSEYHDGLHLLSFKPHRILLQELATQFTVYANINEKDKNDRDTYISMIYREIVYKTDTYDGFKNLCCDIYSNIKQKCRQKILLILQGKKLKRSERSRSILESTKEFFSKKLQCLKYKKLTSEELAIEIITSRRYNFQARKIIREYAKSKVFNFIDSTQIIADQDMVPIRKRNPVPVDERSILFIAGGPASGKSRYSKSLKKDVQHSFVEINTDSYKHLFMPPQLTPKLILGYSQLVQAEASFVKHQVLLLAKKENMHMLIDQIFLNKYILNDNNGDVEKGIIKGMVISADIKVALKRNERRGIVEGRFEDTYSILNNHKNMVVETMKNVYTLLNGNYNASMLFQDNSTDGQEPKKFMEIDFNKKLITITSKKLFKNFLKKKFICVPHNINTNILGKIIKKPYQKKTSDLKLAVRKEYFNFIRNVKALGGQIMMPSIKRANSPALSHSSNPKYVTTFFNSKMKLEIKDQHVARYTSNKDPRKRHRNHLRIAN